MSLIANIEHLVTASGIVAVAVDTQGSPREIRGDESWRPILEGSLSLLDKAQESSIRLVIGKHTVVVQKEGDETVSVVLPTGHAIAKSLRRMIRRMAKKDRGPVPAPRPAETTSSPHTAPPGPAAPVSPLPWDPR